MNLKRTNNAVSEIIGTVILLAIAISTISAVYATVLSDSGPFEDTIVTVVGRLDGGDVVFEHRSGEPLDLNSKVLLTIGGIKLSPMTLDYLLDDKSKSDGLWNIGEAIVFSDIDVTGLQVEVTVIDEETNSVVLWGILQEGRISDRLGGVWHFDDNTGNIAGVWHFDDNTGNIATEAFNGVNGILKPEGIDVFGPRWDDQIKINGISSLRFDGFDDYVYVQGNAISLNAPNEITVEAWFKFADSDLLSEYEYGPSFGYQPDIIQISEGIYGIAYKDQGHIGVLKTVRIASDGTITSDIYNNSLVFGKRSH